MRVNRNEGAKELWLWLR